MAAVSENAVALIGEGGSGNAGGTGAVATRTGDLAADDHREVARESLLYEGEFFGDVGGFVAAGMDVVEKVVEFETEVASDRLDGAAPASGADFEVFIGPSGDGFDGVALPEGVGGVDDGDERATGSLDVLVSAGFPEDGLVGVAAVILTKKPTGGLFSAAVLAGAVTRNGGFGIFGAVFGVFGILGTFGAFGTFGGFLAFGIFGGGGGFAFGVGGAEVEFGGATSKNGGF